MVVIGIPNAKLLAEGATIEILIIKIISADEINHKKQSV